MHSEGALEHLSKIQDLVDMNEFMDDEALALAMDMAVKMVAKPDLPVAVARKALITFQGLAFQFRMQAATYTYLNKGKAGSEENTKKNVYFAASEQCHNMAQTLKYFVKDGML